MEESEYIQIEGEVDAIVFQNPENGYTVVRLALQEAGTVTAVGCMPAVTPGETLVLTGTWATHQSFGEQFKVSYLERRMPVGTDAVYRYLASGAIKNIGPAKARDIVEKFGEKALDIIENESEKLAAIRGISLKRAGQIGAWFRRQVGLRRLMEFVTRFGLKPQIAMNLYRCYGEEALAAVRENPYILVHEIIGADFFEADGLALQLGFEADCPQRIEAALLFELDHNLSNGHTFLPVRKLIDAHEAAGRRRNRLDCRRARGAS